MTLLCQFKCLFFNNGQYIISVWGNAARCSDAYSQKLKERRLEMNLTQEGLSVRAGIKLPTYRRFERMGKISLRGLLQIAFALNSLHDFEQLFTQKQYQSLDEVLAESDSKRKRGKKNE